MRYKKQSTPSLSLRVMVMQRKKIFIQRQLCKLRGVPFSRDTRPLRAPDLNKIEDDGDQKTEASSHAQVATESNAHV